jgi:3-methylcrotonyl-CoA carboxylase alpha subunit
MDRALEQYEVVGVPTNIEFLRRAVKHPAFIAGGVDTGFLQVSWYRSCRSR